MEISLESNRAYYKMLKPQFQETKIMIKIKIFSPVKKISQILMHAGLTFNRIQSQIPQMSSLSNLRRHFVHQINILKLKVGNTSLFRQKKVG
ncbi:hypothetical protein FGO68_gene12985 [Halteria grandinella]|uniref:Uncharacterized protein n=1 Tax=Halteria grandinella TaxID=5974 RepID=A0A8J8NA62_HALGN|nr:hypothetical protein FGO68_gene12985 [Halteria grandinella]